MAIRETFSKNSEEYTKVMAALLKAKATMHLEEVLLIIQNNWNAIIWEKISLSPLPSKEIDRSTIEYYLKLRFHELDVLKANGKEVVQAQTQLFQLLDTFTSLHPNLYYLELETMKAQLQSIL